MITDRKILAAYFFFDETGFPVGPYNDETQALRQAVLYEKFLNGSTSDAEIKEAREANSSNLDLLLALQNLFDRVRLPQSDQLGFYLVIELTPDLKPNGGCVVGGNGASDAVMRAYRLNLVDPSAKLAPLFLPHSPTDHKYNEMLKYLNRKVTQEELGQDFSIQFDLSDHAKKDNSSN